MPSAKLPSLLSPLTTQAATASTAHQPLPSPVVQVVLQSYDNHDWQSSSDALTNWLNARWAESGYQVSRETVCFTLRLHGRDARMGLGNHLEGAFVR